MTLSRPAHTYGRIVEPWICSSCKLRATKALRTSVSTWNREQSRNRSPITAQRRIRSALGDKRRLSTSPSGKQAQRRETKLPDFPARTRFAPSPTGYLHIGGLRTALFSYLLAKRTGGQFLLRIEDTDQKRLVPDAEARLLSDLNWAGLEWDEGPGVGGPHGPYRQSERNDIYQQHVRTLLENRTAYPCFCTPQYAGGAQTTYVTSGCYQNCSSVASDESTRRANAGEHHTIRLHQPADAHKRIYPDLVYDKIQRLRRSPATPASDDGEGDLGSADTILLKSDGTPTYHFANVVDDHLMRITHVIRGVEWSASTPLHYDIYSAFNWTPPQFAHVGLLVDQNQAKLSKRNADMALDVASMRDAQGVLPETLVNFLALLGWSNPSSNDVMDMAALVENFDLKFTRGNAMVRMEKLWFLQGKHVTAKREMAVKNKSMKPLSDIVAAVRDEVQDRYPNFKPPPHFANAKDPLMDHCAAILLGDSSPYRNAAHWVDRSRYFFELDASQIPAEREFYDKEGIVTPAHLKDCVWGVLQLLEETNVDQSSKETSMLQSMLEHGKSDQEQQMHELVEKAGSVDMYLVKPLIGFLREKIAMGMPGPSIYLTMALLGPEESARRLKLGIGEDAKSEG